MVGKYKHALVADLVDDLLNMIVSLGEVEPIVVRGPMVVTSVPLHKNKLWSRGFNQSVMLGKAVASYSGWEYEELLERKKNTVPQAGLSRGARRNNLKNVFGLIHSTFIEGKRIMLVDNIWTTGTTMRECAKTLKRTGASEVWGLTLAA